MNNLVLDSNLVEFISQTTLVNQSKHGSNQGLGITQPQLVSVVLGLYLAQSIQHHRETSDRSCHYTSYKHGTVSNIFSPYLRDLLLKI